jgi:hypothetical protein
MARRRGKQQSDEATEPAAPKVEGVRHRGPWDSSERTPGDDETYLDLGPLKVRVRVGLDVQLPTDGDGGEIGSVVLVADDAALELRAFAATRSGGLWDEVRDDLIIEVERLGGECVQVDGVDWIRDDSKDPNFAFTTYGRTPAVEVIIDSDGDPDVDNDGVSGLEALTDLSTSVKQIPQDGKCISPAEAG